MAQLEYNLPELILGKNPTTGSFDLGGSTSSGGSSDPAESTAYSTLGTVSLTGEVDTNKNDSGTPCGTSPPNCSLRPSLRYKKLVAGNAVPDVVELLVALGVVQLEDTRGTTTEEDITKNEEIISQHSTRQPRYAIAGGQPRQFVVTPSNVRTQIAKAHDEIQASVKRQELLREALGPTTSDKKAAKILERIAMQYPQAIADDPVYVTALRNMHVDVVSLLGKYGCSLSGNSPAVEPISSKTTREESVTLGGKVSGTTRGRDSTGTMARKKPKKSKKSTIDQINYSPGEKVRTHLVATGGGPGDSVAVPSASGPSTSTAMEVSSISLAPASSSAVPPHTTHTPVDELLAQTPIVADIRST
jgi:hypothetical protein